MSSPPGKSGRRSTTLYQWYLECGWPPASAASSALDVETPARPPMALAGSVGMVPRYLGDSRNGDAIELIAPHAIGPATEVTSPVVRGADIGLEEEAASLQEARESGWIQAECPALIGSTQSGKEPIRSVERLWFIEDSGMNVGEEYLAARSRTRAPAQGPVDRILGQIVRDTLPDEQGAAVRVVARRSHRVLPWARVEIDCDEPHERGDRPQRSFQGGALCRRGRWMVHFVDRHTAQPREPVGPRVEPGSEDHDLFDPLTQRRFHGVVDETGPGNRGCSRTRPSMVDVRADDGAGRRKSAQAGHHPKSAGQEFGGQWVFEETTGGTLGRLQRSEERHILRRPTRLSFFHWTRAAIGGLPNAVQRAEGEQREPLVRWSAMLGGA